MRSTVLLLTMLVAGVLSAGCATVFTGTYDRVSIRSEPEGAVIYVDGLEEGVTPDRIYIKRPGIGDTEITLRLDGYEPYTFKLRKEFNAVSVINIVAPIFFAVDIATGAITRYKPLGYDIELEPEGQAYRMDALDQDERGRYLIPDQETSVVVNDEERGLQLVFQK